MNKVVPNRRNLCWIQRRAVNLIGSYFETPRCLDPCCDHCDFFALPLKRWRLSSVKKDALQLTLEREPDRDRAGWRSESDLTERRNHHWRNHLPVCQTRNCRANQMPKPADDRNRRRHCPVSCHLL